MIKDFLDKVNKYWLFLCLTVILCYGFFLTHSSMGIDDEILDIYANLYTQIKIGRPFHLFFTNVFHNNSFLPFYFDFLSLISFISAITLFADCFIKNIKNKLFDKTTAAIFSCLSISFPFFIFIFIFMEITLEFSLNMLLSALALKYFYKYFSENKKLYFLITFLFLTFILCVYETNILFFIISVLFIEFLNIIQGEEKNKDAIKKIIFSGLICSLAYITDVAALTILKKIYFINYNRFDEFLKYDFSSVNNFIFSFKTAFITFAKTFCQTCTNNFGSLLSVICYISFLTILIYLALKKKNLCIFLIGLFIMTVPFFIFLALGNMFLPYRNYMTLGFFNAFVITTLYILFRKNKILSKIILALCFFIVLYSAEDINKIAYTEYLKVQDDISFAQNIAYDLEKMKFIDKPLIFIGTRELRQYKYQYQTECAEANLSTFNWDRYDNIQGEIFTIRSYHFMRELGYPIKGYFEDYRFNSYETMQDIINQIKSEIKDMNIYPQENSIKETDNYVLIKIGNSLMD